MTQNHLTRFAPSALVSLLAIVLMAAPEATRADVVIMKTGSRIACTQVREEDGRFRIDLAGGGVLRVAVDDVKRIDNGVDAVALRGVAIRHSGPAGAVVTSNGAPAPGPTFDVMEGERDRVPGDAMLARQRAVSQGRAPTLPTVVGAMAGVDPVPTSAQLRPGQDKPASDPRPQSWSERSRLSPAAARTLLSRHMGGGMGSGGDSGRDRASGEGSGAPPRVR